MALRAAFIGVDHYRDLQIRDLAGARRDATALWALFSDTVPNLDAELIVDASATVESVRRVFEETLGRADEEDTVIISLSCHGSRDHRIALHDTDLGRLADTTIPMAELAQTFRASKAKVILCILDCCFSGGAPARVIEDSPVLRDLDSPLAEIAGAGRILIAASNVNEPALELPGGGHGLLTSAILHAFQVEGESVSVTAAMDAIMQRVRAEAARMHYVQTPVLLGHVEGGLFLPVLRPGERYFRAFPESRQLEMSGAIDDLAMLGLPAALLDVWKEQFSGGLNSLQLAAVNEHGVLAGNSLLVVAPTSSGKTFIGEMASARAVIEQRKAVFLFPYKALVNEKFDQFSQIYGERLGLRVVRCTGDYQDQTSAFYKAKYDLALLTYETFLSLILSNPATLHQIGLVVVDEAQFITDPRRGIVVELLLTYLLTAKESGIAPQLIALSAVIGDLNQFDTWLGTRKLVTDQRPVPLIEGVIDHSGIYQYFDATGMQTVQLIPRHSIVQRRAKASAQDVIVPLVRHLLAENENERVIVFRNTRGSAEGCAKYLAKDLGLPAAHKVANLLPPQDPSTSSAALRDALAGGTAFHNSNLTREERVLIENGFRDRKGEIRVLAATTTVAAGINTPASTVILAENQFLGEDGRPFSIAEYKNMAGRAGRLGYNEKGRCIIIAETGFERAQLFDRYVLGNPEGLRSSFDPRGFETWVLKLLAQVNRVPRTDLVHLLANTYGGYLANVAHPGWRSETERKLEDLLGQMLQLGLAEEEAGVVRLTLLGQACGRSPLSFRSSLRLVALLKGHGEASLTPEILMVMTQALREADEVYTPVMKKGQAESKWPNELARCYGRGLAQLLQQQAEDQWGYIARCKRALVLRSWIRGVPIEGIEKEFSPNPFQGTIAAGHVRQFADSARFYLGASHQIVTVLLMTNGPDEKAFETLLHQLEVGLPAEVVPLLRLPIPLNRGEYLALANAGIFTPEQLWALSDEGLAGILTEARAAALSKLRPA